MKILNMGSLNYDITYHVDHIILPGETMDSSLCETFFGGKGFNQSVALSKAGLHVFHAGLLGEDGESFLNQCKAFGLDTRYIKTVEGKTGCAVIQIDKDGQNSILLYGGSNRRFSREYIESVFSDFSEGDFLLLQNEINGLPDILERAYQAKMIVALNPSPFNDALKLCDLSGVSYFFINEMEGYQMTGVKDAAAILSIAHEKYPGAKIVLTLGKDGCLYFDGAQTYRQEAFPVKAVDTTAAGDTFTGFFIASLLTGKPPQKALWMAAKAASLAVSRKGAAPSIPSLCDITRSSEYKE